MKYTVEIHNENGIESSYHDLSKTEAVKAAKKESGQKKQVFIFWGRASDGQHGYLNPDGNHEIVGKSW